jgi:transcriptional regulator with XRE-family HTH domain
MENILKNIKKARERKGYSLNYVAIELSICESAYRKIENGLSRLRVDSLIQISEILGVSVNKFFEKNPDRKYPPSNDAMRTPATRREIEHYQESTEIFEERLNSQEARIKHLEDDVSFSHTLPANNHNL